MVVILSEVYLLTCRIVENDFYKQDWRSRGKAEIYQYIFMKWILCFFIGLMMSLIGFFNNLAVENIAGLKFVITSNMMLARKFAVAFFVFASSNLSLTLLASLITAFIAPEAAGSGIPEVKAYLNGVDAPAIFSFRTLLVKIAGSILAVSSSLNIGKAGPMVHTGACIAAIMGQGGSKKLRLRWKWLEVFNNDKDRRDLVTCGSAAGIAAAFRAPTWKWKKVPTVSKELVNIQEWRSALLWRCFFTTAVVAIVLRGLVDVCLRGKCGLFGKGGLIMYDVTAENISYHLNDVPPVLVLAVIGGLLGTSCRPCPPDASEPCPTIGRSGNFKKFQCPPGYYNDLASLLFNTNDDAIKNLFSKDTDTEFHHSSMLLFFATCFFLSAFSYGIVAPVGLFVPVIVTGAAYGRFVGMCVGQRSNLNHGLFAVLGSASLLGGSMRMTVSLCVIVLELTDNLMLLPLIMIVLLISKTVADVFSGNIFDLIMSLKGFPYLEAHAEPYMRQLTVGDVVTGPLWIFRGIEKVGNIVHVLRTTGHNGFPVVDEPELYGLVLRAHLVALLKAKVFSATPAPLGSDAFLGLSADDFANKGLDEIEDVKLSEEEMEMYLDLHPFTNTTRAFSGSWFEALARYSQGFWAGSSCGYIDEARFHARSHPEFASQFAAEQMEEPPAARASNPGEFKLTPPGNRTPDPPRRASSSAEHDHQPCPASRKISQRPAISDQHPTLRSGEKDEDPDLVKCESDELGSRLRWKGGLLLKKNHQTHKRQRRWWKKRRLTPAAESQKLRIITTLPFWEEYAKSSYNGVPPPLVETHFVLLYWNQTCKMKQVTFHSEKIIEIAKVASHIAAKNGKARSVISSTRKALGCWPRFQRRQSFVKVGAKVRPYRCKPGSIARELFSLFIKWQGAFSIQQPNSTDQGTPKFFALDHVFNQTLAGFETPGREALCLRGVFLSAGTLMKDHKGPLKSSFETPSDTLPGIWPCSSPYRVDNIYTGNKNSTNASSQQTKRSLMTMVQSIKEGQSIALGAEPPKGGSLFPQDLRLLFLSPFIPEIGSYEQVCSRKKRSQAGPFPLDR
ncbi:chloride channel-like family protein [Striga asiatica]|uniref:Chloride channel-like family protein n=1 Tax=Striga asiatica TaxID=4170 RepID=A0A5A7QR42_STRAF|nr:chloride channel-like family protein [Striga asiatica]